MRGIIEMTAWWQKEEQGITGITTADIVITNVSMCEPVLIDQSPYSMNGWDGSHIPAYDDDPYWDGMPPVAKAWARYRMPKIFRMPGGDIGVTFAIASDHVYDQGRESPMFISGDEGETWTRITPPHELLKTNMPRVSYIGEGEFFGIPSRKGINLSDYTLPPPAGVNYSDNFEFPHYRLDDCPPEVQAWFRDIKAVRWTPGNGWAGENIEWDHTKKLVGGYDDIHQNIRGLWSNKIYQESPIIRNPDNGELYFADYWTQYETADGKVPEKAESHLMVSKNRGRSWQKRSVIMSSPRPPDSPDAESACEPSLAISRFGELVCVVRGETTMFITYSGDNGFTWSVPKALLEYGVEPQLLQLNNGVLALSYGRAPNSGTGTTQKISFSTDGGYTWSEPKVFDSGAEGSSVCGYTSMVAIGDDSLLLAYTEEFSRFGGLTKDHKQVFVRKITVGAVEV